MARSGALIAFRRNTKATITAAAGTLFGAGEPSFSTDTKELFIADGTNSPISVSRSFNGVGNPGTNNMIMPWNVYASTTAAPSSGYLGLYPIDIWPGPITTQALVCSVTTAQVAGTGTVNNAVLYRDNGTGAGPLVTAAGLLGNVAVTATSTGIKTTALSVSLSPGRYWAGLLYYQGTVAPTTAPQYTVSNGAAPLFCASGTFQLNRFLVRTGLTAAPTDGVAFTPNTGSVEPIVAIQSA